MSLDTKRKTVRLVVVAALILPVQYVDLDLLRSSRMPLHAIWVTGLTVAEVQKAAAEIHDYPVLYRKSIMEVLTPSARASVWRQNAQAFLRTHAVSAGQRMLIDEVTEAHIADRFASPTTGPSGIDSL